MTTSIRNTTRWLVTGALALGGLAIGARDAAAGHSINASFSNPNPPTSSCSVDPINGAPWAANVEAYASSRPNVTRCEVWSQGSTQQAPCPSDANTITVAIMDTNKGNSVRLSNGDWSSGVINTVPYTQSGCADIKAAGWGSN